MKTPDRIGYCGAIGGDEMLRPSLRGALATKQSILPHEERKLDCFASLAMTASHTFAFPRRDASGVCKTLPPHEIPNEAGLPGRASAVHATRQDGGGGGEWAGNGGNGGGEGGGSRQAPALRPAIIQ
jgi:hypothetical protein